MEEGGDIRPCNKDHLATDVDLLETSGEHNKKQWLVCGFNGFGQLKFENKRKLIEFEEFQCPFVSSDSKLLIACSWNCLTIANECDLHLQGFIFNTVKAYKTIKTKAPIKSIDICDKFCLILLESGGVYKLEAGKGEELKEIKFEASLTPIIPQKRNIFGNCRTTNYKALSLEIEHIACGNNIIIAVSATNIVYSGTTEIYQFPKHQRTKQLKCGFDHALLLTSNGDIYAWGNGLRGQLGLEVLRVEETPTLIEALAGIKITYIACGGWHSAAITAFGDLYTWGFNSNGQLGLRLYKTGTKILKEPTVYPLPQLIDLENCQCGGKNINENKGDYYCYPLKVVAGVRHTILQKNCSSIYACGWNSYGQLGLTETQEYCDNFKFVLKSLAETNDGKDKQIVCGNWCTIIEK